MRQATIGEIIDYHWSRGRVARFEPFGNVTYTFYRQGDKRVMNGGTVSEYFSDGASHVWRFREEVAA